MGYCVLSFLFAFFPRESPKSLVVVFSLHHHRRTAAEAKCSSSTRPFLDHHHRHHHCFFGRNGQTHSVQSLADLVIHSEVLSSSEKRSFSPIDLTIFGKAKNTKWEELSSHFLYQLFAEIRCRLYIDFCVAKWHQLYLSYQQLWARRRRCLFDVAAASDVEELWTFSFIAF